MVGDRGRMVGLAILAILVAMGPLGHKAARAGELPAGIQAQIEGILGQTDKAEIAAQLRALVEKNPNLSADIAAAATKFNPGAAVVVTAAAARGAPNSAPEIAAAAAEISPEAAASIAAAAAAQTTPELAGEVCTAVIAMVPDALAAIVDAVTNAVPEMDDPACAKPEDVQTSAKPGKGPPPAIKAGVRGTLENPNVVSPSG